jgi:hypothetical protein
VVGDDDGVIVGGGVGVGADVGNDVGNGVGAGDEVGVDVVDAAGIPLLEDAELDPVLFEEPLTPTAIPIMATTTTQTTASQM